MAILTICLTGVNGMSIIETTANRVPLNKLIAHDLGYVKFGVPVRREEVMEIEGSTQLTKYVLHSN
jgi:hypothetical protein